MVKRKGIAIYIMPDALVKLDQLIAADPLIRSRGHLIEQWILEKAREDLDSRMASRGE